jgi:hypothetical protein
MHLATDLVTGILVFKTSRGTLNLEIGLSVWRLLEPALYTSSFRQPFLFVGVEKGFENITKYKAEQEAIFYANYIVSKCVSLEPVSTFPIRKVGCNFLAAFLLVVQLTCREHWPTMIESLNMTDQHGVRLQLRFGLAWLHGQSNHIVSHDSHSILWNFPTIPTGPILEHELSLVSPQLMMKKLWCKGMKFGRLLANLLPYL